MCLLSAQNELVDEQVKENNGNSVESQSFAEEGAGDNNTKAQHLGIGEKVSSNVDKEYIKGDFSFTYISTRMALHLMDRMMHVNNYILYNNIIKHRIWNDDILRYPIYSYT